MVIQGEVQYLELSWQLSRNAAAELPKKQGCTTRTGTHQGIDQGLLMLAAYKVYLLMRLLAAAMNSLIPGISML